MTSPAPAPATVSATRRRRAFIGATAGHLIEWYDYGIYGFLAVSAKVSRRKAQSAIVASA